MRFAGANDYLDSIDLLDLLQFPTLCVANFRRNASCPAIGNDALGVERAKVRTRCDIAVFEFDSQPQRLDHATAHFELQRIIAEQSKVPGTAARRNSRRYWNQASLCRMFRKRVEVGCVRRFEWGAIIGFR